MTSLTRQRPASRLLVAALVLLGLLLIPRLVALVRTPGPTLALPARMGSGVAGTTPQITALQEHIRTHPADFGPYISLAQAYLQSIRETGDPTLYTKVEALLAQAAKLEPGQPNLLMTQGMLALGRHDFAGALTFGQAALAFRPSAPAYGVIVDAQIELGRYDEAGELLQAMVDLRPDFTSFSRIAYFRELNGDLEGAREAFGRAIVASSGVPENLAWGYVQLGNLWMISNNAAEAATQYDLALQMVPNFSLAQAGKARVAIARGDLKAAATLFQQAFDRYPLPEYAIALGDVYAKLGDQAQSQRAYDLVRVLDTLLASNGVNTDMETALFFADHDQDLPTALTRARAAYAARPSIHTADALAWTLYKNSQAAAAQPYAVEALKLGTEEPLKLFHAGMIAKALGHADEARANLQHAVDLNPSFSLLYSDVAAAALRELGPATPGQRK